MIDICFTGINLIKYICNFDIFKIDGSNNINNINNITIDLENQNSLEMVEITNNNLKFYKLSKDEECILCNVKEKNLFYKFDCSNSEEHKICFDCMNKYKRKEKCPFCNIVVPIRLKDMREN